ncbi:choloylglycine hydrolase [Helicobacter anseris]|uniref:Choloylglycine hydrolase n=1 Tax=Helicobacter anseris TaxID=375926 RepID=A0A3D8J994_9HELI|nr:choloylglycine hydrolase family protein [Helicobacter anseris]RDU74063.1 choloylglycine hydrolase [Helicobacter anseris]
MKRLILFCCTFCLIFNPLVACTGIAIHTLDNKYIQARTIEWGEFSLQSKLIISPRNQEFQSLTPQGRNGIKWKAKYGFVGISVAQDNFIGEGMNEKGLNAGLFYFAHYGSLASFDSTKAHQSIADMELVTYILSNFETTDEVREAFKHIVVVPFMLLKDGKAPPTAHWRVSDAQGKSIVIEIMQGKVQIHTNPIGVLTNSPDFQWQLTNLNNYVNLKAGSAKNFSIRNQEIFPVGAGSGMLGLPGDFTPPSRFVRAAFFLHTAPTPKDSYAGVTQAFHILNLFDLPIGTEFEDKNKIPNLPSATQWTAVSNQSDKEFFYKTMYNSQIRKIDLKTINFETIKPQALNLDAQEKESFENITIK